MKKVAIAIAVIAVLLVPVLIIYTNGKTSTAISVEDGPDPNNQPMVDQVERYNLIVPSGLTISAADGSSIELYKSAEIIVLDTLRYPEFAFVYDGRDIEQLDVTMIDFWLMYTTFLDDGWTCHATSLEEMYVLSPPDGIEECEVYFRFKLANETPDFHGAQMIDL